LVVVIGVKEGYREAGLEAMRMGCAEVAGVVENLWKDDFPAVFRGFWAAGCGNLLFHVEHFVSTRAETIADLRAKDE
jgi:hypothetical protein